jgi:hypothetical protein
MRVQKELKEEPLLFLVARKAQDNAQCTHVLCTSKTTLTLTAQLADVLCAV